MERRDFLTGVGIATAAAATSALASDSSHHKHVGLKSSGFKDANVKKIIESASDCIEKGEACVQHCVLMLAMGDKTMAPCMAAVQNMLAACEALRTMASLNTTSGKNLKAMAMACAQICDDCAAECEKHAKKHRVCNACMKSCQECAKNCKNLA